MLCEMFFLFAQTFIKTKMLLFVKKLLIACLFVFLPLLLFSQTKDTIIDSHYTWQELQTKFISYYKDSSANGLTGYQKQAAIRWINEKLSLVNIVYVGFDNRMHSGQLVCNKAVANDVKEIFTELLQLRFPVYQCKPISDFGFTDIRSMQANNTSCFDYRQKTGSRSLSKHSYGLAIDINPIENPYKKGEEILPYNNNESIVTGRLRVTEETGRKVINIFSKHGWVWGGSWHSLKDYMHFEKR